MPAAPAHPSRECAICARTAGLPSTMPRRRSRSVLRRLAGKDGCEHVRVELRTVEDEVPGEPFVEATGAAGGRVPASADAGRVALHDGRPSRWQPGAALRARRCSTSRSGRVSAASTAWWRPARTAQLEVLPRAGLLRDSPEPNFVLDPVALDAAGQVSASGPPTCSSGAQVVFPFRLAALDVYGAARRNGRAAHLRGGDIGSRASSSCRSDIDVLDCERPLLDAADRLGGQALRRPRALLRRWPGPRS